MEQPISGRLVNVQKSEAKANKNPEEYRRPRQLLTRKLIKKISGEVLHNLLHNCSPERPETPQNDCQLSIIHNNIRRTESFRNRQVASSTLAVGSIFNLLIPRL